MENCFFFLTSQHRRWFGQFNAFFWKRREKLRPHFTMCDRIFSWNFGYSGQDILLDCIIWSENYGPIIQSGLQILLVIELKLRLNIRPHILIFGCMSWCSVPHLRQSLGHSANMATESVTSSEHEHTEEKLDTASSAKAFYIRYWNHFPAVIHNHSF